MYSAAYPEIHTANRKKLPTAQLNSQSVSLTIMVLAMFALDYCSDQQTCSHAESRKFKLSSCSLFNLSEKNVAEHGAPLPQ